jgi:hypothetical protein
MPRTSLPIESLPRWAFLNDVDFLDVKIDAIDGKGYGLIAERALARVEDTYDIPTLLAIPRDLVLSAEAVEQYAKVDKNFRELRQAAGRQVRSHFTSFI